MVSDPVLASNVDDFADVPAYKGNVMVQPSPKHRQWYGVALILAAVLVITGIVDFFVVFSHADHPISDTLTLAVGLVMIVVGVVLAQRFATPYFFAVAVSTEGISWRNLFGWHHAPWNELKFVLVRPHTAYGGREAHLMINDRRFHFGWVESSDRFIIGPLEVFPEAEAKALLSTITQRAKLERREAGAWVQAGDTKTTVDTGQFGW